MIGRCSLRQIPLRNNLKKNESLSMRKQNIINSSNFRPVWRMWMGEFSNPINPVHEGQKMVGVKKGSSRGPMGKRGALLLMALGFISQARALDRIQIVAPSKFVLGEGAFSIRVKPLNGDAIDSTPCPIRFLNLPQGVTVASKTLPKEDVLKGETEFEVHVASSVKTGPLGLIVQTSSAPVVLGSAVVVVEGSPARLVVSPLPTEVGSSSRFPTFPPTP
jgi:hypothetical protein